MLDEAQQSLSRHESTSKKEASKWELMKQKHFGFLKSFWNFQTSSELAPLEFFVRKYTLIGLSHDYYTFSVICS